MGVAVEHQGKQVVSALGLGRHDRGEDADHDTVQRAHRVLVPATVGGVVDVVGGQMVSVGRQQVMLDAREIKNIDEIILLNQAAGMVDAVYHMIGEELKPGVRENDIVAKANEMLYEMGSDDVEAINAISGERCNPHPHNFTDRMVRPGDQAFFDVLHAYSGYRTCYYRTFNVGRATDVQEDAYKQCREWIDASIDLVRPGVSTDEIAAVWPEASEFGFSDEMEAFALQFGRARGNSSCGGRLDTVKVARNDGHRRWLQGADKLAPGFSLGPSSNSMPEPRFGDIEASFWPRTGSDRIQSTFGICTSGVLRARSSTKSLMSATTWSVRT